MPVVDFLVISSAFVPLAPTHYVPLTASPHIQTLFVRITIEINVNALQAIGVQTLKDRECVAW